LVRGTLKVSALAPPCFPVNSRAADFITFSNCRPISRAREKGKDYALLTARNAATAVEKNRARQGWQRA